MRALQRLPGTDTAEAFAVNASGVVVGVSIETGIDPVNPDDDAFYPTIWFPEDWTGGGPTTYTAWTPYNLGEIVGAGASGAAYDINDANVVVGYADFENAGVFFHRPFVWDLSTWIPNGTGGGAFRHHILGDFGETELLGGEAHGINNESDPLIVGWALRDDLCGEAHKGWGFHHRLSAPDAIVQPLKPLPNETDDSQAYAVTTALPNQVAGLRDFCASYLPDCSDTVNPLLWEIHAPPLPIELTESPTPAGSVASDINDAYVSVGYQIYDDPDPSPEPVSTVCRTRAVLWDAAGGLKDLHYSAGFPIGRETDARAITQLFDESIAFIAGAELQFGDGVLWKGLSGTSSWSAWLADDLEILPCEMHVRSLNDLNQQLRLVGAWAGQDPDVAPQAILMWPYCAGDANLDATVDAVDLAIVIGEWGTPWSGGYDCESVTLDFDESGSVDAGDIAIVLGGWGSCTTFTSPPLPGQGLSQLEAAVSAMSPFGSLAPDQILAVLGFATTEDFATWLDSATPAQREAINVLLLNASAGFDGGEQ